MTVFPFSLVLSFSFCIALPRKYVELPQSYRELPLFPLIHSQVSFTQSSKISRPIDFGRLDVEHWFPNEHLQEERLEEQF